MRILMLSEFFPPVIGGIEQHVHTLSTELAARGHEVSVVTTWQKGFPSFQIDQGVRIHRIYGTVQHVDMLFTESERRYLPPFPDPGVMYSLYRVILQEHPDVIHAHDWMAHSFTLLKKWSKAKFIVSLHGYSLSCVQKRLMHNGEALCSGPELIKCLNCATQFYGVFKGPPSMLSHHFWAERERRAVDMFLPVSKAVVDGNQLDKYKLPYRIIPNFIPDKADIACEDSTPFLEQLPKEDFLLFAGDISSDKGAKVLMQAFAEIHSQIPLVLIGRVTLNLPEDLPSNVLFMGRWPHNAVMAAWSRCTIALVPSIWHDPCPTVAMEAMSMGKPVIASRIGGLSDIILDDETGILVEPNDVGALRNAIQYLLDNPMQKDRMGAMAKQRIGEFQAKRVVSRIEEVYRSLLQS